MPDHKRVLFLIGSLILVEPLPYTFKEIVATLSASKSLLELFFFGSELRVELGPGLPLPFCTYLKFLESFIGENCVATESELLRNELCGLTSTCHTRVYDTGHTL